MGCFDRLVVGIFSREDSRSYEWLTHLLISTWGVKDVRPVLITNTWNDFQKEVPKCSVGILYHSKSRGRLNVTDVTDSLYDKEVKFLSQAYGLKNVIAVIGDMEDSSDEKKALILREQITIRDYTSDLFLFSEIRGTPFQGQKKKDLEKCIQNIASREFYKKSFIRLIILAVVLLIAIIVVSVCWVEHPRDTSTLSPPVTNVTSHLTSSMETKPPSTTGNVTSSLTFSMETTSLSTTDKVTSSASSMEKTPPSTTDNITSSLTSSMETTSLSTTDKVTSSASSMEKTPPSTTDKISSSLTSSLEKTPPSTTDNVTSSASSMEKTPPSTTDNVTSSTSQRISDKSKLMFIVNSMGNTTRVP